MTARTPQHAAKVKATKLHSELVRARGACENCGERQASKLQCAHIISRRYARTRVRLDNAFCLCARCHMHFTEWPLEFAEFTNTKVGRLHYEQLMFDALGNTKVDWVEELAKLRDRATAPDARAVCAED